VIFLDIEKIIKSQANTGLPENYSIRDGFLFKGDTPVSLATSGIVEIAVQGFLHVDETEEYKTK
jgi:hypothetical protein